MSQAATDPRRHRLLELAGPRRDMYRFLSAAFLEPPTPGTIRQLRDSELSRRLESLWAPAPLEPLRDLCEDDRSDQELSRQLQQEFMNLFRVPGPQYVTPYESVYCDLRRIGDQQVGGLLMGKSTIAVKRFYRMAAMEISPQYRDLPDHVGLELHFLSRLCAKEIDFHAAGDADKLDRARRMQRDFLAAHLNRWLGKLHDKIATAANETYYPAIAALAVAVTDRDLHSLAELVGPPSDGPPPQES